MSNCIRITKEEMEWGFAQGRSLTQEEWAHPDEIKWVNELLADGKATIVEDWTYKPNFQCERRRVKGVEQKRE